MGELIGLAHPITDVIFKYNKKIKRIKVMSEFWENYKKNVAEGASKLSKPPKDVSQQILWLKAYVDERMEKEDLAKYVGKTEDGTFGFTESYVNYLMNYAFEAGEKSREYSFNKATADMKKALDKVKDALDEAGWIDHNW